MPTATLVSSIRPERIDALLAPWIPDAHDRVFVVRCALAEGPVHHRGASYALLALLGLLVEELGPVSPRADGDAVAVPMRVPPHVAATERDHEYPLQMPLAALERLAPRGSTELSALVDCLLDGPAHHALANAAMVCLLDALLARVQRAPA